MSETDEHAEWLVATFANEITRLQAENARLRTLGEGLAEALKCVLDDSHSYESEGYARDHARTALAAWNEGAGW